MITASPFRPAWWLPGPHLQTLWPVLVRPHQALPLRRERIELPDGDFIDLDWTPARTGPVVLVLHGLEGSSRSHYAERILERLRSAGYQGVLMHFRGCSGEPNRLARGYTAGDTGDLESIAALLRRRFPDRPLAAIGYSLGGNVLLKWLGRQAGASPLACAVAVSVPFELAHTAERLEQGFSRLYQRYLLAKLRRSALRKVQRPGFPLTIEALATLRGLRRFDDALTAPLHGYSGATEYYRDASSRQYLHAIRIPTLLIHARDDPFMGEQTIPLAHELSESTTLDLSRRGGHMGFVSGTVPGRARYWLDERIMGWLDAQTRAHGRPRGSEHGDHGALVHDRSGGHPLG
jgi:predicted alpha/beta-fold hydrolase